jgi:demethylmenaquinone methyltransferase/2-methoxy-6-polyprenyl-1,4-benzoquinol methylase/phosphoethanolamine N-methyltransferase
MIQTARRKAVAAGATIEFRTGVIEEPPFPNCQFDLVLSSLMMHRLPGALK